MGTIFPEGDKPKNNITISRGNDTTHQVGADGVVDRSFAQPNPSLPAREVEVKAHANEKDEAKALSENSVEGRDYKKDEDEVEGKDEGQDAE